MKNSMIFLLAAIVVLPGLYSVINQKAVKEVVKNVSPADIAANWKGSGPIWQKDFEKTGRYHESFDFYIKIVNPPKNYRQKLLAKLDQKRTECIYFISGSKGEEAIYIFANFDPLPKKE